jgi:hypothetical protein
MRRPSPALVVALGTAGAVVLALLLGWAWNSRVSYVHWNLAEQVRDAARRDISFLGEMGGRAPGAARRIRDSWAITIAVAWAVFVLALAGLSAERVAAREPVVGRRSWGFLATTGFMAALTLIWIGVNFT